MASATLDPTLALDNSMGAMMIGTIISAVLHGICLLQAFIYWQKYRKDVWWLKSLVATTVLFDAIHLFMISTAVYHYVVTNFHSPDRLKFLTWTVLMEALFTGVNAGIVQTFYTYRIWRLSKHNWLITGTILFLILCTTGCGVAWVILSMRMQTYEDLLTISPLTITINALSTAVDVGIAGSLCLLLHTARTGFRRSVFLFRFSIPVVDDCRSDTIINKLIVFVVNTGVLTSACAIAALICLVASPKSLLYATFYFCIGRLYTNSFLATLNARKTITSEVDGSSGLNSVPTSVISPHATGHISSKAQNISIRIDTTKEAQRDEVELRTVNDHATQSRSDDEIERGFHSL
ncbi:hypothetical protein CVT24_006960 [Panaeolus cyanescens]|uniref:DUF6534 domain-containing protein n=1 Tax=Panaeolus cyanescens TaxID=181874 RepID=A0A409W5E2_9AGAR|nr:hypothetical protein CVT24_006960 [Panaeolus cyanescens]